MTKNIRTNQYKGWLSENLPFIEATRLKDLGYNIDTLYYYNSSNPLSTAELIKRTNHNPGHRYTKMHTTLQGILWYRVQTITNAQTYKDALEWITEYYGFRHCYGVVLPNHLRGFKCHAYYHPGLSEISYYWSGKTMAERVIGDLAHFNVLKTNNNHGYIL